jgi:hypothetical protein
MVQESPKRGARRWAKIESRKPRLSGNQETTEENHPFGIAVDGGTGTVLRDLRRSVLDQVLHLPQMLVEISDTLIKGAAARIDTHIGAGQTRMLPIDLVAALRATRPNQCRKAASYGDPRHAMFLPKGCIKLDCSCLEWQRRLPHNGRHPRRIV